MENEEKWNTFARTGRIQDYLAYAGMRGEEKTHTVNSTKDTESSESRENRETREKEL